MVVNEEKLKSFEKTIFAQVDKQVEEMIREANEYKQNELRKFREEEVEKFYGRMQDEVRQIKFEYKGKITKEEISLRRELIAKRNEFIERIFAAVKLELLKFVGSDEYPLFLAQKIMAAVIPLAKESGYPDVVSFLARSVIFLTKKDLAHKTLLEDKLGAPLQLEEDGSIKLGGFALSNESRGIYFSQTLDEALNAQRTDFVNGLQTVFEIPARFDAEN